MHDPAGGTAGPGFVEAGRYEVDAGGATFPAQVSLRPPFDPGGLRMRGG